jgi:L-ascorbate metabolism protein UlaG (beta-lactamase superfamily)
MKRRQFVKYAGIGFLSAATGAVTEFYRNGGLAQAQGNPSLNIQWLGHTCFLISSGEMRILVNPFRTLGCTAGYRLPTVPANLVLASSLLFDEGAVDSIPRGTRILTEPGLYQLPGMQMQGISVAKDRLGGRRFGRNVAWRWTQAGLNILHLGALASPIETEQRILMGRPDVLMIPVGGGAKAYSPQEAQAAIAILNPKVIIPTHFRTQAADAASCDIVAVDEFLNVMAGTPIERKGGNDPISLTPASLPSQGSLIIVPGYSFA